jgi:hypothetical protein
VCTLAEYKSFKSPIAERGVQERKKKRGRRKEITKAGCNQTHCSDIYSSSGIRTGGEGGTVFILTHLQDYVKLPTLFLVI